MNETRQSGKLTGSERLTAVFLRWAPWLAFLLITFPAPLYFLFRYFTGGEDAALYMLLTLTSLVAGSLAGAIAVILLLLYRRYWAKNLRNRLAADGISTDELSWFIPELTVAERRMLRRIERQNPLLADAYRETLAARLTATRVLNNAKREAAMVEIRLRRAAALQGAERDTLEEELRSDRARLARIEREASERRAKVETRLQMIEAAASREASAANTENALRRLDAVSEQTPLALESARLEREAHDEAEKELRESDSQTDKTSTV